MLTYIVEGSCDSSLRRLKWLRVSHNRAANNSRSSDNGRPNFAIVRRNCNLGRTSCPASFLLQHLTKSFTNTICKWFSQYESIRAKCPVRAGAHPGFLSMKWLGVFYSPLDGILVHRRVTPSSKFVGTYLYTWVKRGTVRVKCLAQEHNAVPWPRLEPQLLDLESSALTIRPPRLPQNHRKPLEVLVFIF